MPASPKNGSISEVWSRDIERDTGRFYVKIFYIVYETDEYLIIFSHTAFNDESTTQTNIISLCTGRKSIKNGEEDYQNNSSFFHHSTPTEIVMVETNSTPSGNLA